MVNENTYTAPNLKLGLPEEVDTEDEIIFGNNEDSYGVLKGGVSPLPEVTSADNGKVLTVIDGSWGVGEASVGIATQDSATGIVTIE